MTLKSRLDFKSHIREAVFLFIFQNSVTKQSVELHFLIAILQYYDNDTMRE